MERGLGSAVLTGGGDLRLAVVESPDAHWAPRLTGLLGHKGPVYLGHIAAALQGPLDALETLFYLGLIGGVPVTVAMIAGAHGAGILGHVYTVPEWRGQGASTALFRAMDPDLRARGYRLLTLGTNPNGHARRIYERIGFRQMVPGSGDMLWVAAGGDAAPQGPRTVGPVRWDDWGWISAAAAAPAAQGEDLPRSRSLGVGGRGHVEGAFARAMQEGLPLSVLRRGGVAVGWACLSDRDASALGRVSALDFYVRPDCSEDARHLLEAVPWPERPVVCALGGGGGEKARLLRARGFTPSEPLAALGGLVLWTRRPE